MILDHLSQLYQDMIDKMEKQPMYKKMPALSIAIMDNESRVVPLVTLQNTYSDAVSHIIKDDGCFVLINSYVTWLPLAFGPSIRTLRFRKASHWFPEAVKALGEYLAPKPIYFADGFCDAHKYYENLGLPTPKTPESDADVARKTLRRLADDSVASPEVQVQAAATLLEYSDE